MASWNWVTALLHSTEASDGTMRVTLTLGLLLAAALVAGMLGQMLRLPKVTSYLLAGVALNWIMQNWFEKIPHEHVEQLEPVTNLAIALVLFNLGCHFPFAKVRKIFRRVVHLSIGELGASFLFVTIGLLVIGAEWEVAVLLGALAMATAPATTILVLKETESEGPVTEYTNSLVALNNLAAIVAFELLFLGVLLSHGLLADSPIGHLRHLGQSVVGSVALGFLGGVLVSFFCGIMAESRRLVLLMATIILLLGICVHTEMPYLLTFLAMGVAVANTSTQTRQILGELDRLTGLLCVVFFVTHGAELQLDQLTKVGIVGAAYLALRSGGKYLGIRWASRQGKEEPAVRRWLGLTLLAQAGAAIALSNMALTRTSELGSDHPLYQICAHINTVVLGTVVVFEIAGPILIRLAVLRSGEVPLMHAIHHPGVSPLDQLRTIGNRLLIAVGLDPWGGRTEADLTIRDVMRQNIPAVPQNATFNEIVSRLEHSRDNTFPVVDASGNLVGLIRYRGLSHALFDMELGSLVRAADITTPAGRVLFIDEPVSRASALFALSKDDCIPVIAGDDSQQFLGLVRRRDVLRLLIREHSGATLATPQSTTGDEDAM